MIRFEYRQPGALRRRPHYPPTYSAQTLAAIADAAVEPEGQRIARQEDELARLRSLHQRQTAVAEARARYLHPGQGCRSLAVKLATVSPALIIGADNQRAVADAARELLALADWYEQSCQMREVRRGDGSILREER